VAAPDFPGRDVLPDLILHTVKRLKAVLREKELKTKGK
jgi:hypothetical protein